MYQYISIYECDIDIPTLACLLPELLVPGLKNGDFWRAACGNGCFSSCNMIFHMSLSLDWWGNLNLETVFSANMRVHDGSWSKPKAQETFYFRGSQFWSRFLLVNFKKTHQSSISKSGLEHNLLVSIMVQYASIIFKTCYFLNILVYWFFKTMVQWYCWKLLNYFFQYGPIFQPQTHPLSPESPGCLDEVFRGRLLRDSDRICGEGSEAMVNIVWRRHPTLGGFENRGGGSCFRGAWAVEDPGESPPKKRFLKHETH